MPINNKAHLFPAQEKGGYSQPDPVGLASSGPMLDVQLDITTALAGLFERQGAPLPQPASGLALIDTGANVTSIDDRVAQDLGLQPIGTGNLYGVGGAKPHNVYAVKLRFPGSRMPDAVETTAYGADLASFDVPGYRTHRMIALLGRDILKDFVLIYHGQLGMFTLAH